MLPLDDIRLYLPKYLSTTSEENLFEGLRQFESVSGNRNYYTCFSHPENVICQGDGLRELLLINLPDTQIKPGTGFVVSNTCDIATDNTRLYSASMCYCPILNLDKYASVLEKKMEKDVIEKHLESIKRQRISSFFFLPKGAGLQHDSFVALDKVCHCDNRSISRVDLNRTRVFTLSSFGHYLLVLKLSIHFSRIREGIDRDVTNFGLKVS